MNTCTDCNQLVRWCTCGLFARRVAEPPQEKRDTYGPAGTYGCACVSRDAGQCSRTRYGRLALGPCADDATDEYDYLHSEECECPCHQWDDDE